jgi:hypothetical protein
LPRNFSRLAEFDVSMKLWNDDPDKLRSALGC